MIYFTLELAHYLYAWWYFILSNGVQGDIVFPILFYLGFFPRLLWCIVTQLLRECFFIVHTISVHLRFWPQITAMICYLNRTNFNPSSVYCSSCLCSQQYLMSYSYKFDFSQFTLEWYKFYIFISMFVNISAEYSLEKKENRCYLRARTSTHRLHSHWHVNRSNMSLYAIHLISLAQPNHGFEPWTNTFVVCYSIRWVS